MKKRRAPRPEQLLKLKALRRTTALMIRLTDSQRRRFEQRAALHGLSTSTWARMILLREVSVPSENDE